MKRIRSDLQTPHLPLPSSGQTLASITLFTRSQIKDLQSARGLLWSRKYQSVIKLAEDKIEEESRLTYLSLLWHSILLFALLSTQDYDRANAQLNKLELIENPSNLIEVYTTDNDTHSLATKNEILVPFCLRVFAAQLPLLQSSSEHSTGQSVDGLYSLYDWSVGAETAATNTSEKRTWLSRVVMVAFLLSEYHMKIDNHKEAFSILQELLKSKPPNHPYASSIFTQTARVCFAMGSLKLGEKYLDKAKTNVYSTSPHTDRGLLCAAQGTYKQALVHFEESLKDAVVKSDDEINLLMAKWPTTVAAATNNLAVAHLYNSDLFNATYQLEGLLMKHTMHNAFSEAIKNVVTLYEFSPSKNQCLDFLKEALMNGTTGVPEDILTLSGMPSN